MLNEYNMTNAAMAKLLPVEQSGIWTGMNDSRTNATISWTKQDLPYAERLDEISILDQHNASQQYTLAVYGEKSIFKFRPNTSDHHNGNGANVIGVFTDGSPAVVNTSIGSHGGGVTYAGLHLGFSYFHGALPKRPVDRTPSLKSLTNFVPHAFNAGARTLAEVVLRTPATAHARPLLCSNPLVEVGLVTRTTAGGKWNGTVIPLVDWSATEGNSSGNGFTRVTVTLNPSVSGAVFPWSNVTLASCGLVAAAVGGRHPTYPGTICHTILPPSCDHTP